MVWNTAPGNYFKFFFWGGGASTRFRVTASPYGVSRSRSDSPYSVGLLDEWWVRRRDLYLTTHNTHKRETSMPPVRFEATISEGERPQTHAWDRAVTGVGNYCNLSCYNFNSYTEEKHINVCKDRQFRRGDWSRPPTKIKIRRYVVCVCLWVGGKRQRERERERTRETEVSL